MTEVLGTWIDGAPTDVVPVSDRGLHFGDGLFETISIRNGRARFLAAHLERLATGCRRLHLPFDFGQELLRDIDAAIAKAPSLAVLKLIVTRGDARRRGYAPQGGEVPRRVVSLYAAAPRSIPDQGVDLHLSSIVSGDQPALAGIKHLNRLENVLAAREARGAGAFDALMPGADGRIVSGAMSNLFIVAGNELRTPLLDRAGVAGVMRSVVIRECGHLGLALAQRVLLPRDLATADEVFITNALIGVVPVRRVGEHAFKMNAISRRIAEHVETLDA
jgi:4-amino-4-deoxychorismate lyase